jgi:hypothetical protein
MPKPNARELENSTMEPSSPISTTPGLECKAPFWALFLKNNNKWVLLPASSGPSLSGFQLILFWTTGIKIWTFRNCRVTVTSDEGTLWIREIYTHDLMPISTYSLKQQK